VPEERMVQAFMKGTHVEGAGYFEKKGDRRPINDVRSCKAATPAHVREHANKRNAGEEVRSSMKPRCHYLLQTKSKTDWPGGTRAGEVFSQVKSPLGHRSYNSLFRW
jgi:hypothetical protein